MSKKWVKQARRKSASAKPEPEPRMAKRLVRPVGQGTAFESWLRAARRLQLPHGLVIEGARGAGKTTVLQYLTAALLCPSDLDEDEPCGMCRTCTRIANDLHPDVHVVRRPRDDSEFVTKETSFHRITVHQVRALQQELQRHAIEGRARVATFVEGDHLQEDAQNMLLKTLEEPGEATFLLLEVARPEHLLPTVRSRVQRLRVLPLTDEVIRRELDEKIPGQVNRFDDIVGAAQGSLGLALEAGTERAVQLHDLVRGWLDQTQELRPFATARAVLQGVEERRHENDAARMFLWLLRSELRRRGDALVSSAEGSYPAMSLEPWTTWLERTLQAERDLELMIPAEQVLTACLVQLMS